MTTFSVYGCESDWLLKFDDLGAASAATISEGEVIDQGENNKYINVRRGADLELPRRVAVVFPDQDTDYQPNTQMAQRLIK